MFRIFHALASRMDRRQRSIRLGLQLVFRPKFPGFAGKQLHKYYLGLLPILGAPSAVCAAPKTFQDLVNLLVILIDNATTVLIVAGLVIFFWGVSANLLKQGEKGTMEKIRAYLIWGVIILFVMVSIWGILRLLQATLFGNGSGSSDSSSVDTSGGSNVSTFPGSGP